MRIAAVLREKFRGKMRLKVKAVNLPYYWSVGFAHRATGLASGRAR